MTTAKDFETKPQLDAYDHLAPDGSEIRLLLKLSGGGLCHCTLPVGKISAPIYHKTVEEIWYFISGEGEIWRRIGNKEETVQVRTGVCVSIPARTSFQFRNMGKEPLCFVITTMPPWPGPEEAVPTNGPW